MSTFPTWQEARIEAQTRANRSGQSYGLEHSPIGGYWFIRPIPNKTSQRCGCDARCEPVEPMRRADP